MEQSNTEPTGVLYTFKDIDADSLSNFIAQINDLMQNADSIILIRALVVIKSYEYDQVVHQV